MRILICSLLPSLWFSLTAAAIINQPHPINYGLARISHRARDFTSYRYDSTGGAGVCAYVIDSGISARAEEFQNRVHKVYNFVGLEPHKDLAGHGTHVAGILGSTTYGVAKNITIFDVKVMDADGSVWPGDLLSAIEFVADDSRSQARRVQCPKGFIVNLSIGYNWENATWQSIDASKTINNGIQRLINQKDPPLAVFVAAGNENHDVSLTSPANIPDVCTIGALDKKDFIFRGIKKGSDPYYRASNYGPGVDLWAPGTPIISTTNETGPYGNFSVSKC